MTKEKEGLIYILIEWFLDKNTNIWQTVNAFNN
jgi:hypothetical protein